MSAMIVGFVTALPAHGTFIALALFMAPKGSPGNTASADGRRAPLPGHRCVLGSVHTSPPFSRCRCPECSALAGEGCYGARPVRAGQPWRRASAHMLRVMPFAVENRVTSSRELYEVLSRAAAEQALAPADLPTGLRFWELRSAGEDRGADPKNLRPAGLPD